MKSKTDAAVETVRMICRVLDDKKAEALSVLDVSAQSSITDYLVLATATSEPHLRALRIEVEKVLDAAGVRLVGMEKAQESGWLVIDAFDVMVHIFLAPMRERYALERLWQDASEVALSSLLSTPPAKSAGPRARSSSRKRAAPKKKATRRRTK